MKKYIQLPLLIISFLFILNSCKKPAHETQYVTLNETIQAGNTYILDLSAYGDADDQPSITKQAASYVVSQISTDAMTAKNIYTFSDTQKSTEKQTVVITLKEQHRRPMGRNCNQDVAVITINFTIN
jgi:hypothetical protein